MHPHHAPSGRIGFQPRKSRRVEVDKLVDECVVPVEDDHAILAEVESSQVTRPKYRVSVAGTGDGVRNYMAAGKPPGIVRFKDRVVVRSIHARGESIINDVAGYLLIAIWRIADGQPVADHQPARRCRSRGGSTRRWCRRWRGDTRG